MKNDSPVTVAIIRKVKPGHEEEFERALHEFVGKSVDLPGQLGVHILRPSPGSGSREYGILRKFNSAQERDEFYKSTVYKEWKDRVASLVEGEPRYEQLSGLETWFTLPGQQAIVPPPRYKMAIVTLVGVYPVSLLIGLFLSQFLKQLPLAWNLFVVSFIIVVLLTWVIMPNLTKLFKPWLYPNHGWITHQNLTKNV
jgi:antibiotic biosynthesis monooxygenase (ABM) superfamily enzyme